MRGMCKGQGNRMRLILPALSVNEGVARAAIGVFCGQCDPSTTELADVKCAVSEAVTNCIVHAYREGEGGGNIYISVRIVRAGEVRIAIRDRGCGIPDVRRAREPLFTTDAEGERSGMGFTVMENFMDRLSVRSKPGRGTLIVMYKRFGGGGE